MDYFKIEQKLKEVKHFAEFGLTDLKSTGLVALDEYWMLKKGYPLFVAGNPGSGKTEFTFEVLVNTSKLYGWKHFIYCGEGGNIEHIYTELLHKYLGKPYRFADELEKIKAEYFISEHFIICNHDNDYSISDFYTLVSKVERELDIKFNTTLFDPFNDIKDETDLFGGREDKYLAYALKECRISSKKNNRIDILVNHVSDVLPNKTKNGVSYLPPALPTQWAGGKTWWRRAFMMILVYRPALIEDENGIKPEENETHIIIQKFKPKGVGKKGTIKIFFNWKRNQFYCKVDGQELYSCEKMSDYRKNLLPNTDFTESINTTDEPF